MPPLTLMAAVNGARRTKSDHPGLPITVAEVAAASADCAKAGAQAVHLHVRDTEGLHTLDVDLYRAATRAVREAAGPDFVIQITTEAVGRFTPAQQIETVRALTPQAVSIAYKELAPDASAEAAAGELYAWAAGQGVAVQHIVYSPDELDRLLDASARGVVPGGRLSILFPLGRYAVGQESDPLELVPFVARIRDSGRAESITWMCCAFGRAETAALVASAALGGNVRVGFENSFYNADGSRAADNAERVREVAGATAALARSRPSVSEVLWALGKP
jgi:3-keto-5-aminohexanoate cleavage enzyme